MNNHRIEVTNKQVIDFIGEDFCKFHGTFESHKNTGNGLINNGIGFLEGYFLIAKYKSENGLYLKIWIEEKDIPLTNALLDNSDKVEDIVFLSIDCKFYLSYMSRQGIVELTIKENNKDNLTYPKTVYCLKLTEAKDV